VLLVGDWSRSGHEDDERLTCIPPLPNHEVAEEAFVTLLVVHRKPLLARPGADGVANRVAELGRKPAALDVEHVVPATGPVKAEPRPVGRHRERVLELVPVVELRRGRQRRFELEADETPDPCKRVCNLSGLRLELGLVREILKAAAAAGREMDAGRLDARRTWLENFERRRLRVISLHLRDACPHRVARESAPDEDHEAV
jgi:hypothetical protein